MKKLVLTFSLLLLSFVGLTTFSAHVQAGETVDIVGGQNDFFAAGSALSVSESIQGDLRAAGNSVLVNKAISQDAVLAGNMITINANIGDDLKAAANQVIINASVSGDLIVFANSIIIGKDVIIGGDLIAGAANISLNGNVMGKAKLYAGKLHLAGFLAQDADIRSNEVSITSGSRIAGFLNYTSKQPNTGLEMIASGAQFHEDTLGNKRDQDKQYLQENKKSIIAAIIGAIITFKFFSLLAISLIARFFLKHRYERAAEVVRYKPWNCFRVGLATLIGLPIVGAILLFTGLLAPLGGVILAVWVFTLIFIEVALILVATGLLHGTYNTNNKTRKDVMRIVVLSLVCSLVSGVDGFLGIFAIGGLILLKKDSFSKIMSEYYPTKRTQ